MRTWSGSGSVATCLSGRACSSGIFQTETCASSEAVAKRFREGRERSSRAKNARGGPYAGGPHAIPGEKMVYAHVSDSTVMMYRMVPSRAPESDEVPQIL